MENKFQKYRYFEYRYLPSRNVWQVLYDHQGQEFLHTFDGDKYRIDQCIDIADTHIKEWYKLHKEFNTTLYNGQKEINYGNI